MINWKELELLLSELPLENSYIQKVTEHSVHSFTLSMYSREEKAWLLYFEIATPDSIVCRTGHMRKKAEGAQRFTQYMRAHFVGRKVTAVRQLPFDRAFTMTLANSEDSIVATVRLFSGIGANIIVTDSEGTILELMYRRPQRGEERGRKLILEERASEGDRQFSVRPWEGDSFNAFMDMEGSRHAAEADSMEQLRRLGEKRDRELAMLAERLRRQEERVKATSGYGSSKAAADLLASSIHLAHKGDSAITLPGWDGSMVTIPLDPALSPQENLERLYQRYRKDRRTHQMAEEEAAATRQAIADAESKYRELFEEGNLARIAKENGGSALVTGEALSQVASQTLDAMSFTDSMTELLVLRPLVGMDKEEITEKAKAIGSYETSILPYEDCCVVFSPKHPVTRPVKEVARRHFEELDMDAIIDEAVRNTAVYSFDPMGREIRDESN